MEIPELSIRQLEEGIRSLYRDPVGASDRAIEYCLDFKGLHYPPAATVSRAAQLQGLKFVPAPGVGAIERSIVVYLRERDLDVVACAARNGVCCGGLAGLVPEVMSGLEKPQGL
jgi:hypothetical protein